MTNNTQNRERYLYAAYYRDPSGMNPTEDYNFQGLFMCDDSMITIVGGMEYIYLGSLIVPEQDFQNHVDGKYIENVNKELSKFLRTYHVVHDNPHPYPYRE